MLVEDWLEVLLARASSGSNLMNGLHNWMAMIIPLKKKQNDYSYISSEEPQNWKTVNVCEFFVPMPYPACMAFIGEFEIPLHNDKIKWLPPISWHAPNMPCMRKTAVV